MPETLTVDNITPEVMKTLSINQIKSFRVLLDKAITDNEAKVAAAESARNIALSEIGNFLHESVPVSNNEVSFGLIYCPQLE